MTDCIKCLTRLSRLAGVAIVGAAFLAPMPARAQSAEETVAFVLWGLEEDGRTKRLSEHLWEAEGHGGDRSSFGIQRLTDCLFRVSSQVRRAGVPDVLEFDYVLDFAAVKDYSAWFANGRDQRIIVKIEGNGWYSKTVRSKTTGRGVFNITAGSVGIFVASGGSVQRLKSAFAYLRSAFCPGRGRDMDDVVRLD